MNLEQQALEVERATGIGIEVYGFDLGSGLPVDSTSATCRTIGQRASTGWTRPRCGLGCRGRSCSSAT